ncbi:hypothetical protein KCU65_g4419, partial [Aureobasidium melanogenum]
MSYRCRECAHNGKMVNCRSYGNMKSHLGLVHRMGPFRCSVPGCTYVSIRRETIEAHIRKARRSGPQRGRHAQATYFRCPAMADALQDETDLCLLPHTVPWPNLAPAAAPPAAAATTLPGPATATHVTVAPSGKNPGIADDEDGERDDEDDVLGLSLVLLRSGLVDKIVDLIYKAVTLGKYYSDRIDELDIPDQTRNVVSSDGRRVKIDPARMQLLASMIIGDASRRLNTAADGLKVDDLQEEELEELALSACKAMGDIPVAFQWYLRFSTHAGSTGEDMARLASMQQAILDEFEVVEEDEDDIKEDE